MAVLESDITISTEEISRRIEAIRQQQEEAQRAQAVARGQIPKRRRPGRRQSAETRKRLSERQRRHQAARALAEGEVSPLRKLRIERGLTVKQAAAMCRVARETYRTAELRPYLTQALTWVRIADGYRVSTNAIRPAVEDY